MKNIERAREWFQRARSNMARAKAGKLSHEVLYEDLCYDAQQAAEKALKSLCILHGILFPRTHDIAYLIELIEKRGVHIPEEVHKARVLTGYAVETRYPGDYAPVNEDDFLKAVDTAEKVVNWVESKLQE
ncbi:MAG: HEPN domain-containing protein [Deltaproteobacteria bacterium]|nr:HEPN domain-containing protein [Deltaproteobacteria bacterium]